MVLTGPFVGGFCGAFPGAGRTTLLLVVAQAMLELPQHLRLVVVEGGATEGSVRRQLELPEGPTLEELVRGAPGWENAVQRADSGFSVVAAPSGRPIRPPISADQIERVVHQLRTHFQVVLFDHGSDLGKMPDAHLLRSLCQRLVVVVPATLAGAEAAAHTLSFLEAARGPGWLRQRVVVVLNRVDAASRIESRVVAGWLGSRVAEVVSMPYEPALAGGVGGRKLSGRGRLAVTAIVRALLRRPDDLPAMSIPRPPAPSTLGGGSLTG